MEIKLENLKREFEIRNGIYYLRCYSCKNMQEVSNFENKRYTNSKKETYLIPRSGCKSCRNYESKIYHRIERRNMNIQDALRDIETCNFKRHNNEYRIKMHLLGSAKSSAKNKGMDFNLEIDDLILPDVCPILKKKLVLKDFKYTYSIDRVDNNQGYIKGNVRIISRLANLMKNCATNEELLEFSKNIGKYIEDIV